MVLWGPPFGLHGFFAADDVTGIDAPADLIHGHSQTANAALINLSLLHTLSCHFFYCLLDCHAFPPFILFLSSEIRPKTRVSLRACLIHPQAFSALLHGFQFKFDVPNGEFQFNQDRNFLPVGRIPDPDDPLSVFKRRKGSAGLEAHCFHLSIHL